MARARNIKPGFFTNELLGTYDPIISLLFAGLWCLADKDGILEDRPLRIKAELFPYRDSLDVNGYLTVLERDGFVVRYVVERKAYIQVCNFAQHQHPHHTERPKGYPWPSQADKGSEREQTLTPLNNSDSPSDSLIPDSLIPDSKDTHPNGCVYPPAEKTPACPPCPTKELIELYHQTLPELPRVVVMNDKREAMIRQRWRDFFAAGDFVTHAEGIECFRWYFAEKVKPSKFLTGRANSVGKDRRPFLADLEWLIRPSNFAKVVEGRYEEHTQRH